MDTRRSVGIRGIPGHRISITFPYDEVLISILKSVPGHRWHPSRKYWSIPETEKSIQNLLNELYKSGRFTYKTTPSEKEADTPQLEKMVQELSAAGYAKRTIKIYKSEIQKFFDRTKREPSAVRREDIVFYLEKLKELGVSSRSSAVHCITALQHFYRINSAAFSSNPAARIPLPRKLYEFPDILSRKEVMSIFSTISNRKHKFLLMLIYSAGLRVSEAVKLRLDDIDFDRQVIHIKLAKGNKDRFVMFSEQAESAFYEYAKYYKVTHWLFPGQQPENHISVRTAQAVFYKAKEKAGITKQVSIHSLRHAFATHLLETGTDLRYIQELLGHKSSRTTEMYTHVTKTDIRSIKSPLDMIGGEG